jgi:4-alpha-glucanotransferase
MRPAMTSTSTAFPRSAGVLLHPTSLPSRHGIGDVGAGARAFVDWLAQAGCTAWQILPLVPAGSGWSPYASQSALAGNPLLIDLDALVEAGALTAAEATPPRAFNLDRVEWDDVVAFKMDRLSLACARLAQDSLPIEAFTAAQPWVVDDALFVALKAEHHGQPWWQWAQPLKDRDPAALAEARVRLRDAIARRVVEQAVFEEQWQRLRHYANDRGVRIVGDVPIYVADDSVDVWANRAFFQLDDDGRPTHVAGCPPDIFAETGQWWGSPLYRWDVLKADQHRWWVQRMKRNLDLCDVVRIDHFRGFAGYWSIPATAPDARSGSWVPGPGMDLFNDLRAALGDNLPVIAEDLGVITDDVVALREGVGLPGMKILQFAFGAGADNAFLPHHHVENGVVYTGTHDNNTTRGWWQAEPAATREHVREYLGSTDASITWDLIKAAMLSVAHTAIVPLQDVLDLDGGARMNMPGLTDGNWAWRVRIEAFHENLSRRLKALAVLGDRLPRTKR